MDASRGSQIPRDREVAAALLRVQRELPAKYRVIHPSVVAFIARDPNRPLICCGICREPIHPCDECFEWLGEDKYSSEAAETLADGLLRLACCQCVSELGVAYSVAYERLSDVPRPIAVAAHNHAVSLFVPTVAVDSYFAWERKVQSSSDDGEREGSQDAH